MWAPGEKKEMEIPVIGVCKDQQGQGSRIPKGHKMPSAAQVTQAHAPPEAPSRFVCGSLEEGLAGCPGTQTSPRETENVTHLPSSPFQHLPGFLLSRGLNPEEFRLRSKARRGSFHALSEGEEAGACAVGPQGCQFRGDRRSRQREGKEGGRVEEGAQMLPRRYVCLGLFCCSSCSAARVVTVKATSMTVPKGDGWASKEAGGTTALATQGPRPQV